MAARRKRPANTIGTSKLPLAIIITVPMPLLAATVSLSTVPTNASVMAIFSEANRYLLYEQAISFQIAIGAVVQGEDLVARELADRAFPRGQLVLASLRGRQLPLVAYAFAEHLRKAMDATGEGI